jgi:tRNA threonylcarbamoyladenosine biosynthesis protein TsaE
LKPRSGEPWLFLPDEQATLNVGAALGGLLRAAWPIAPPVMLRGALGSGKTTLARGLVAALPGNERAEVCSPSFTILNFYPTEPPVAHADLYRCPPSAPAGRALPGALPEELEDALDPSMPRRFLVLLEWPEFLPGTMLPAKRLDILLEECHASRRFSLEAHGDAARALCMALFEWTTRRHPAWMDAPAG